MADAIDLYPMPSMLEAMFVCQNREHALEPFIGELHYPATPLTDEVFVIALARHGLVALKPLAELLGPHQTALYQQIQRPVDGRSSYPLSSFFQLPSNGIDGEVVLR